MRVDTYIKYGIYHASMNEEIEVLHLPDIGFYHLPDLSHIDVVDDYLLPPFVGMCVLFVLLSHNTLSLIKRFCVINGIAFLLRSVSIFVTFLPKSNKTEINEAMIHSSMTDIMFEVSQIIVLNKKTVNDMMFSGHTSVLLTITYCTIMMAGKVRNKNLIRGAIWSAAHIILVFIISTHKHYSVDVYISYIITLLIYACYVLQLRYAKIVCKIDSHKPNKVDRFIIWYEMLDI
jgi:hypothetical protein